MNEPRFAIRVRFPSSGIPYFAGKYMGLWWKGHHQRWDFDVIQHATLFKDPKAARKAARALLKRKDPPRVAEVVEVEAWGSVETRKATRVVWTTSDEVIDKLAMLTTKEE